MINISYSTLFPLIVYSGSVFLLLSDWSEVIACLEKFHCSPLSDWEHWNIGWNKELEKADFSELLVTISHFLLFRKTPRMAWKKNRKTCGTEKVSGMFPLFPRLRTFRASQLKLFPLLTEYDRESDEYVAPFPFRPVPGFFSILYIPIEETGIAGITCLIPEFSCQGSTERQHQTLLSILSLSPLIRFTALKAYRMDRNWSIFRPFYSLVMIRGTCGTLVEVLS